MSSYVRNVLFEFAAVLSSMAPGNMKSDLIGLQRSKLIGKSYSTRKLYVKNSDGLPREAEPISLVDMDQHCKTGDTLTNNAPHIDPSVMNATVMSDVSNVAQSDDTKEILLAGDGGCMIPQTNGSNKDRLNGEISHLKVLSMLHLDVIEQQQRQIQLQEREVQRLRAENDTLRCRLERMNRRTHLAEKSEQGNHSPRSAGRPRKPESPVQKRKRRSEYESSVSSPSKLPLRETAMRGSHLRENKDNLNSSLSSLPVVGIEIGKRQRRLDKLVKKEEKKGTNRQDSKESKESKDDEKYHRTDIMYPCLSDLRVPSHDPDFPDEDSVVMVPSWRVVSNQTGSCSDGAEECDDAAFERRHCKLEQDERKRKRWDIQRIRELREHERLVNKQKQREFAQFEHILTSFYPGDNDAEYIEMGETIPVVAFGVQIPAMKPSEFELPWFDAKQRERDEQRRKTRRRSNRR